MRIFFLLFCTALSFFPAAANAYSPPELEGLLAPVALYPDPVVQDVLTVSAAPDQAARDAAWANLAAYPELRERMAQSPQWMADLGDAWRSQPGDVMAVVQTLRARASSASTVVAGPPAVAPYPYGPSVFVTRIVVRSAPGVRTFHPHAHPQPHVYSQPYRRVPESRRGPIVQSRTGPAFHASGLHNHIGARRH